MSQRLESVKKTAKNIFSIPRLLPQAEPQERRASVFGMVESGKTTILGLLHIICTAYANKANAPKSKENFHFYVHERTSNIRQIDGELRLGMFPEKTPPGSVFEADFMMRFGNAFGKQVLRLPFCETAGETFNDMLERFGKGQYDINPAMQDAALIHDYILDTDAIILIAPVTRVLGMEPEKGARLQLPDVNLSRLLSAIYGYKMEDARSNPNHRPIKGICVFLTKYDAVQSYLEAKHMDLKTKEGVHAFMEQKFPQTYSVLGWYGLENVKFWPTGVSIESQTIETGQLDDLGRPIRKTVGVLHPDNPSRGWKIKTDQNRNMPVCMEDPIYEFIEWCKDVVMA